MFNDFVSQPAWNLAIAAITMILIGISRTGFRGASTLAIPVFASLFGGRISASVVLIMFITADIIAIRVFRETVKWEIILRLAPWVVLGVAGGALFGTFINDRTFAVTIGIIVLVTVAVSVLREIHKNPVDVHGKRWLSPPLGLVSGFASMVGNSAGAFMVPYMLALGLDKKNFLGTAAWFYFLMNLIKVPFHVFVWKSISGESLLVNAVAIIPVLVGTFIGSFLSGRVSERLFRYISFGLAAIGAIRLLIA